MSANRTVDRARAGALLWLLLAAGAWAQVPNSFETEDSLAQLEPSQVKLDRVQEHASEGQWALRVVFPGNAQDTWPGIGLAFDPPITARQALQFDAYNPMDVPVPLSWRVDTVGAEQGAFGGATIPPGKTQTVEIWLSGADPVTRIYPYVRMPRTDQVLIIDSLRWFRLQDYFVPLRYVDGTPPPTPTQGEHDRGFLTFQRPFTDVVFSNTVPRREECTDEVGVFATPGEYEPATLALHALQDLADVSVSFSGLPATGEVLPIRCLDKRVVYSSREFVAGMPVLCERRAAVEVPTGQSKCFVIDLKIDADAKPGLHTGRLHVRVAGTEKATLPFRLRVLPYRLPEPPGMFWGEYYQGPRLAEGETQWSEFLRRDMADMREHGMTSVGLCFGPSVDHAVFTEDGACALNFDGSSHYEQFMDLYRELGYPAPVILLADSGQDAAARGNTPYESEEWARRYKAFWTAMQEEHRQRGWAEAIVQPVDEPGWQGQDEKDRNVRCLRLLKGIPGLRTEQDGPGDDYFHHVAGPFADVWNYNGAVADRPRVRAAQADGRTVLIYNCDVESYRPEVDRYTAGWFQIAGATQGCFNWAYISFYGDPYDDQDHKTGSWMHVYPPLGDEPGGPSTGWIGAREGVDDYRYVHALREATGADADGRRALEEIVASLGYSPAVRDRAQWTTTGALPDGTKTIGGTLKLPNGWEHAEYDKRRWQVARATLEALAAARRIPPEAGPRTRVRPAKDFVAEAQWSRRLPAAVDSAAGSVGRAVSIPVQPGAPIIDGELNDGFWRGARKLDPFMLAEGRGRPRQPTDVLVSCDGALLYVAATCHEDNVDHLTATVTEEGGPVWQDDCFEVFVDASLGRQTYRQIMVNSLGTQGWHDPQNPQWRAASRAAARVGTAAWTVELAVPLADLGIAGAFGFNVCRERRPLETLELSCWSPTGDAFGSPGRFGVATLGGGWIGEVKLPPAGLGENPLSVTLVNEGAETRVVRTELRLGRERQARAPEPQPLLLAPGRPVQRDYTYEVASDAPLTLTFRVLDAQTQALLAERTLAPTVLPPLTLAVSPRMSYLSETRGTVRVEVNIADNLRERTRLELALTGADGRRALRAETLPSRPDEAAPVRIDLSGIPEGSYRLRARLLAGGGTPLAEVSTALTRLRGPFD